MMFNENERFTTLSELSFNDLKELLIVLRDLDTSEVDISVKNNVVVTNIDRFFPDIDMDKYLSLTYICKKILDDDSEAESDFNGFKESFPDLRLDKFGMSEPNKRRVWEGQLAALDAVYDVAVKMRKADDKNSVHSQVCNAKTLECLEKMVKCDPYIYNRKLMLEKLSVIGVTNKTIKWYEDILKKHSCDYSVLNKFIQYIKLRNYNEISIFYNHFVQRLELLDKEDCLENESCRMFLERIKNLSKKD